MAVARRAFTFHSSLVLLCKGYPVYSPPVPVGRGDWRLSHWGASCTALRSTFRADLSCHAIMLRTCLHLCLVRSFYMRCTATPDPEEGHKRRLSLRELCAAVSPGTESGRAPTAGVQKAAELAALTPSLCSEPLAALVDLARSVLSAVLYESSARKPGVWQTPPLSRVCVLDSERHRHQGAKWMRRPARSAGAQRPQAIGGNAGAAAEHNVATAGVVAATRRPRPAPRRRPTSFCSL